MKQEEKLYSQTELADKIGVSKGTLSKWISKNDVSPETIKGNRKLYKETIIEKYKQDKKINNTEKKKSFSTVEYLLKSLENQLLLLVVIDTREVSCFLSLFFEETTSFLLFWIN